MTLVIWTVVGLLAGAIPFAVILARVTTGRDIRGIGDRNPGAVNAWKAAGGRIGMVAVVIETLKGAIPVLLASAFGNIEGWGLCLVGLASIIGHAFSPFLSFRGGKAIAVTSGVWAALTPWGLGFPIACLCQAVFHIPQRTHAWTVVLGFTLFGIIVMFWLRDEFLTALWAVNLILVIIKQGNGLKTRPYLRNWLIRLPGLPN